MHKDLWKTLTLTSDGELMDEPLGDTGGHGDGVQRDGAGHGACQPDADDEHGGGDDDVPGGDDERQDDGLGQGVMKKARLEQHTVDVLDDVDGLGADGPNDHVDVVAGDTPVLATKFPSGREGQGWREGTVWLNHQY